MIIVFDASFPMCGVLDGFRKVLGVNRTGVNYFWVGCYAK